MISPSTDFSLSFLKNYKIIFLIAFSPKYAYLPGNDILNWASRVWTNEQGDKIGIWKEDWGNQLGFKFKEFSPTIDFEVWRPDIRADKIYEHIFENGVINKSFPVRHRYFFNGFRCFKDYYSPEIEHKIEEYYSKHKNILLVIPASRKLITSRLLKKFTDKVPILCTHFLNAEGLLAKIKFYSNPILFLHYLFKSIQLKRHVSCIKNLLVVHKKYIPELEKKYTLNVFFTTVGADLSFWKSDITKNEVRLKHKIPLNKQVILVSSRLEPNYQIEQVLKVITKLTSYNVYYIFTSHGTPSYQSKLKKIMEKNNLYNYVNFTGYVDEDTLRDLYIVCDYFFMSSLYNAGPMSTFIAMIMGKPIITTDSGLAAEILQEQNCGLILPTRDYSHWEQSFRNILDGKQPINLIDVSYMHRLFDWQNIVMNWFAIFNKVIDDFEGKN